MLRRLEGHIDLRAGDVTIYRGSQMIVDYADEFQLLAAIGADALATVKFGYSGGKPVTPALRAIYNPVASVAIDTPPLVTRINRKVTGVTVTATWTPPVGPGITYDMMGLYSQGGILVAAKALGTQTAVSSVPVLASWSLSFGT